MDPVQALAILSLGAFVTVLVTALFYVFTVRPRLLEPVSLPALGLLDETLQTELTQQRAAVERLNSALAYHTHQLEQTTSPDAALQSLHDTLRAQSEAAAAMTGLLNQHTALLGGLGERLDRQETALADVSRQVGDLSQARLPGLEAQIAQQADQFNRLHSALQDRLPAPGEREQLTAQIQSQAARLLEISRWLDQWAAGASQSDSRLADQARALAELDRQLAVQSQAVQRLETRVSEHTTMLISAASEQREQAGILERVAHEIGQILPLVKQLLSGGPAHVEQDRLTDINGIGPVYAGRLYQAGVHTFRQLAALTPQEVFNILDEPAWRMHTIAVESWIEQARLFASQRQKTESLS